MEKLKGLDLEGKKVLDAGTGACNMTKYLEDWGADVVSIDYRHDWQDGCRESTKKAQFITGDLSDLNFLKDGTFDYVVCNFVVSALSETKNLILSSVFREMFRVLTKESMLIIIDYYPFDEELCPGPCHEEHTELWRLENAIAELLGRGHLEELPPEVLGEELRSIGFTDTDHSILLEKVPWPDDLLKEHEEGIREDIGKLDEGYLKDALSKKLESIMDRTKGKKIESGSIYELRAEK